MIIIERNDIAKGYRDKIKTKDDIYVYHNDKCCLNFFNEDSDKYNQITESSKTLYCSQFDNCKQCFVKTLSNIQIVNNDKEPVKNNDTKLSINQNDKNTNNESINNISNESINNKSEGINMFNKLGLQFGMVENDDVKISIMGLAIKNNEGKFVSFNNDTKEITDVDLMDLDLKGMLMQMPVGQNNIVEGDIILHQGTPVIVQAINNSYVEVIDVKNGEMKKIMPTKNIFGFNFYTKYVSLINFKGLSGNANENNPFGNMLPLMLMSKNNIDKDNNMLETMLMMNMFNGQDMNNNSLLPLMLLSKNDNNKDNNIFETIMMMNMFGGQQQSLDMNNMLPLMLLSKNDNKNNSILETMIMMNMFNGNELNLFGLTPKKDDINISENEQIDCQEDTQF